MGKATRAMSPRGCCRSMSLFFRSSATPATPMSRPLSATLSWKATALESGRRAHGYGRNTFDVDIVLFRPRPRPVDLPPVNSARIGELNLLYGQPSSYERWETSRRLIGPSPGRNQKGLCLAVGCMACDWQMAPRIRVAGRSRVRSDGGLLIASRSGPASISQSVRQTDTTISKRAI